MQDAADDIHHRDCRINLSLLAPQRGIGSVQFELGGLPLLLQTKVSL
jgi:hypothetical protein